MHAKAAISNVTRGVRLHDKKWLDAKILTALAMQDLHPPHTSYVRGSPSYESMLSPLPEGFVQAPCAQHIGVE